MGGDRAVVMNPAIAVLIICYTAVSILPILPFVSIWMRERSSRLNSCLRPFQVSDTIRKDIRRNHPIRRSGVSPMFYGRTQHIGNGLIERPGLSFPDKIGQARAYYTVRKLVSNHIQRSQRLITFVSVMNLFIAHIPVRTFYQVSVIVIRPTHDKH